MYATMALRSSTTPNNAIAMDTSQGASIPQAASELRHKFAAEAQN
jgi:hypothetical protein